jgi:Fur family ferric uptake transcriptional regulator
MMALKGAAKDAPMTGMGKGSGVVRRNTGRAVDTVAFLSGSAARDTRAVRLRPTAQPSCCERITMDQHTDTTPFDTQPVEPAHAAPTTGRLTPARQTVLDILNSTRQALSHHEIESQARANGVQFDRVTLYRALDWLVGNGLAHKVSAEDRIWRFNAARASGRLQAHFHCASCGTIHCLETTGAEPSVQVPAGFRTERIEVMLRGVCATCAQ